MKNNRTIYLLAFLVIAFIGTLLHVAGISSQPVTTTTTSVYSNYYESPTTYPQAWSQGQATYAQSCANAAADGDWQTYEAIGCH